VLGQELADPARGFGQLSPGALGRVSCAVDGAGEGGEIGRNLQLCLAAHGHQGSAHEPSLSDNDHHGLRNGPASFHQDFI
jgi:hypothetical protein